MKRFGVRLFVSYLAVVAASTTVAFAGARALAPTLLEASVEETAGEGATVTVITVTPRLSSATSVPEAPAIDTTIPSGDASTTTLHGGAASTPSTHAPNGTATTHVDDERNGNGGSNSTTAGTPTTSDGETTGTTTHSHGSGNSLPHQGGDGHSEAGISDYILAAGVLAAPALAAARSVVDPTATAAFIGAFDNALLFAAASAFVVALASSFIMSRRIVRPVTAVREATVRLAGGDYRAKVPIPAEFELAGLAHDVNILADKLATTEERRSRLVADVAHELRTPLTTIQGSMEALIDGIMEPSEKIFTSVADEASRLQRIVNDLGLLSRIDEGVLDLAVHRSDVGAVVCAVAERLRPQFEDQAVALDLRVPDGLIASVDDDRMAQVFTNLIGNALGHSPPRSTVTVSGTGLPTGEVQVCVTDEGDGIDPSDLETIFQRFRRGAGTKRPGSGLGLSIAQSLVHAHGGTISASSEGPGRGSTFVVRLPALSQVEWSS